MKGENEIMTKERGVHVELTDREIDLIISCLWNCEKDQLISARGERKHGNERNEKRHRDRAEMAVSLAVRLEQTVSLTR